MGKRAGKTTGGQKRGTAPRDRERRQLISVPLRGLRPNRYQPRNHIDPEKLKGLANTIGRSGLLHPILVTKRRDGGFRIAAGHRRAEACKLLGWNEIDAFVTDGNAAEIAIIENIQRETLHPLDEAKGYLQLIEDHGHTQAEVGTLVGKSQAAISRSLKLLSLPQDIQNDFYSTSNIPASVAFEIASIKDHAKQREAWERAMNERVTVREAREEKKPRQAQPPTSPGAAAWRKGRAFRDALEEVAPDDQHFDAIVELVDRLHAFVHG